MAATNDLGQWYKSIPPITRVWFTASIAVPLATRFGLVHPGMLILAVRPIINNFQIWRLFTSVFYADMNFAYLINLYFIYQYSSRLETSTFEGKPADYIFCLLFLWICNVIVGIILPLYILMIPMIMSVMYIWCQLNKETMMSFWFGMQFKAMYMPWVILVFNWIVNQTFLPYFVGIVVGHLYFFLVFKYPQDFGGARLIQTPNILYRYFPNARSGISGFGTAPTSRREPGADNNEANRGGVFGGRGHVLGDR